MDKNIFNNVKKTFLTLGICFSTVSIAQVGVDTTTPRGALDVSSTTQGIVFPNVALVNINTQTAINPQGGAIPAGTVVYNTATSGTAPNNVAPGLYYWNGSRWVAFAGSPGGLDWSLSGNSGTTAGTNFLGTTDAQGLFIYTNNTEAMRIGSTQRIGVNLIDQTWAQFFSYTDDASVTALVGYSAVDGGTGLNGRSQGSNGTGLFATNNDQGGWGAYGFNSNTTSGVGTVGQSAGSTGTGLVGLANGTSYSVLTGFSTGTSGTGQIGIYGMSTGAVGSQRYGGYFTYDMDNNLGTNDADSPLALLAGRSDNYLGTNVYFGGYFSGGQDLVASTPSTIPDNNGNGNTGDFAYVGARWLATNYKIIGNGNVSTIINGIDNDKEHIMFAVESPEILFQDFGSSKLTNGKAYIKIDPILSKNIVVDQNHPLKVFIQLEGDCNGVYVTNKTSEGFMVKELKNGNSNVNFSYQLVATRINRTDAEGNILSKHEDVRLPIAPRPIQSIKSIEKNTKRNEENKLNNK